MNAYCQQISHGIGQTLNVNAIQFFCKLAKELNLDEKVFQGSLIIEAQEINLIRLVDRAKDTIRTTQQEFG